jgi:hypothetical protein
MVDATDASGSFNAFAVTAQKHSLFFFVCQCLDTASELLIFHQLVLTQIIH